MSASGILYLALLAALSAERAVELRVSRRNARRLLAAGGREAGRAHFRLLAGFHALFPLACAAEVLLLDRPWPGGWGYLALAAALAAQGLRWWCVRTLRGGWSVRVIAPARFVPAVDGPYRFLRHPNYLAVIVEMAAVPLIHGAWLTATLFTAGNAALLAGRIRIEERALGPAYRAALRDRPRLLPGVRRG